MPKIENMSYDELVDLLAEKTSTYTTVYKDQRNTLEHSLLQEEIQDILNLIESKKDVHEIQVNPGIGR